MTTTEILTELWKGKEFQIRTRFAIIADTYWLDDEEIPFEQVIQMWKRDKVIRDQNFNFYLTDEGLKAIGKPTKKEMNTIRRIK